MKTLAEMDGAEIDALLGRAKKTLASHSREIPHSPQPGDLRAAMATVVGTLHEIAALHPGKADQIAGIVAEYRQQSLDG